QPPLVTPTRTPTTGRSAFARMSLTRAAAASVSRITWGRGRTAMSFSLDRFGFRALPRATIPDDFLSLMWGYADRTATPVTTCVPPAALRPTCGWGPRADPRRD